MIVQKRKETPAARLARLLGPVGETVGETVDVTVGCRDPLLRSMPNVTMVKRPETHTHTHKKKRGHPSHDTKNRTSPTTGSIKTSLGIQRKADTRQKRGREGKEKPLDDSQHGDDVTTLASTSPYFLLFQVQPSTAGACSRSQERALVESGGTGGRLLVSASAHCGVLATWTGKELPRSAQW